MLRTDNILESVKKDISTFCSKNKIIHQISCSHTFQQNRVVERKHRHILNVARTIIIHMSVLKYLWSNVVLSDYHLINMIPSSILNKRSPVSYLFPNKTRFSMTPRVFGCTSFVQSLSPGLNKLSPRSIKCVFVEYCRTKKDICVIISPSGSIWYLLMLRFLNRFLISPTGSHHYI